MSELAINGGRPVRTKLNYFPAQITIGVEETRAALDVMDMKKLSDFRGNWIPQFWGGVQIQKLQEEFSEKFNAKYSLAVNSCTSALQIACMAIGLQPGDEVIVTPWSMSCSATAPLVCGAIPVFADIDRNTFNLDPVDVLKKITTKTKAIIVVDLFGKPFDKEINAIAKFHNLIIIEDAAQAIGSMRDGKYAGTLGDIGCFSFTQGKHLTCGEGGMITTDNEDFYKNCALIRNHSEAVISAMSTEEQKTIMPERDKLLGFNLRMTEIQAAILRAQLKKVFGFIMLRMANAYNLCRNLSDIPFLKSQNDTSHAYYVQGFHYDRTKNLGIHRDKFIAAVNAELAGEYGRPDKPMLGCGYIKPLYMMPLFTKRTHWAFKNTDRKYSDGDCPVCEKLWREDFFLSMYHNLPLEEKDIEDISKAFHKVYENAKELL